MPAAFAQVSEDNPAIENSQSHANAAFKLMEKITDGQDELATIKNLIKSNSLNMGEGLTEHSKVLDKAAELVAQEKFEQAAALLESLEGTVDDIYTQLYAQIDSRQDERFETFVEDATYSISFIAEYGADLGISDAVIDELEVTLAILQSGDTEAILAATSESSDLGLTASMFPEDHPGFGKASVAKDTEDEPGKVPPVFEKLPLGIKARYDISTDSEINGNEKDNELGDLPPGYENKLEESEGDLNALPDGFVKKVEGVLLGGDGLPTGYQEKIDDGKALSKGFLKKLVGLVGWYDTSEFDSPFEDDVNEDINALLGDYEEKVKKDKKDKKVKEAKEDKKPKKPKKPKDPKK